jgi:hypothetical protein
MTTAGSESGVHRSTRSVVATVNGDQAMVDMVQELVHFLSQHPLAIDDVIARVGTLVRDPGAPMPIELRPALVGVRSASLARYPDTGLPYTLTLEPESDARPTPAELKTGLGDYHQTLTHSGRPVELVFYPAAEGSRWRVVVLALLAGANDAIEAAPIASITFRRDPVTPETLIEGQTKT